jgi:hypothetical protein
VDREILEWKNRKAVMMSNAVSTTIPYEQNIISIVLTRKQCKTTKFLVESSTDQHQRGKRRKVASIVTARQETGKNTTPHKTGKTTLRSKSARRIYGTKEQLFRA